MLGPEYCLARAERLRMLMLTASDPAAAVRLRGFVQKYRILAERSKTASRAHQESPSSNTPGYSTTSAHLPKGPPGQPGCLLTTLPTASIGFSCSRASATPHSPVVKPYYT